MLRRIYCYTSVGKSPFEGVSRGMFFFSLDTSARIMHDKSAKPCEFLPAEPVA
jgi:hypothetical protein